MKIVSQFLLLVTILAAIAFAFFPHKEVMSINVCVKILGDLAPNHSVPIHIELSNPNRSRSVPVDCGSRNRIARYNGQLENGVINHVSDSALFLLLHSSPR